MQQPGLTFPFLPDQRLTQKQEGINSGLQRAPEKPLTVMITLSARWPRRPCEADVLHAAVPPLERFEQPREVLWPLRIELVRQRAAFPVLVAGQHEDDLAGG